MSYRLLLSILAGHNWVFHLEINKLKRRDRLAARVRRIMFEQPMNNILKEQTLGQCLSNKAWLNSEDSSHFLVIVTVLVILPIRPSKSLLIPFFRPRCCGGSSEVGPFEASSGSSFGPGRRRRCARRWCRSRRCRCTRTTETFEDTCLVHSVLLSLGFCVAFIKDGPFPASFSLFSSFLF